MSQKNTDASLGEIPVTLHRPGKFPVAAVVDIAKREVDCSHLTDREKRDLLDAAEWAHCEYDSQVQLSLEIVFNS